MATRRSVAISFALRIGLLVLAGWALRRELAGLDVQTLVAQLRGYGARHVVLGVAATIASFVLLGVVELLALAYTRCLRLVPRGVALITPVVSHALSQSLRV